MNKKKKRKINIGREVANVKSGVASGISLFFKVLLDILITVLLVCALTGIIVVSAFSIYVKNYVEADVDVSLFRVDINNSTTTKLYYYEFTDRENRIGEALEINGEKIVGNSDSTYVTYDKISSDLVNAFIAIEDERFPTHNGVDWKRTVAAAVNFFIPISESDFGGSTITQQLIKNVTGEDDYKIQRKIQEILWALDLETKMDKEEILELYLNIINLGNGCYGVEAAAYGYFGKHANELTLIEAACIASITNNPSRYNPITNPEANAYRRNLVLKQMRKCGYINQREFEEAYNKELVLNVPEETEDISTINSWYVDMVIEDVINDLVDKGYSSKMASLLVYNGGLKIYTLMDPDIQDAMERIYLDDFNQRDLDRFAWMKAYYGDHLSFFAKAGAAIELQSSAIVIDPYTGDVLGVVGARGEKLANRVQNYATQTKRPPGSSIKPLSVFAPAVEEGIINFASVYDDVPFMYEGKSYWPQNYDKTYMGLANVDYAIIHSLNTVAVKVLDDLGIDKSFDFCYDTLNMKSLVAQGVTSSGASFTDKGYASLALGQLNLGLTVREIAAAYSIFANDGVYSEYHSYNLVTDSQGNELLSNNYKGTVALSEETASVMTLMLQDVITDGGIGNYGKRMYLPKTKIQIAGKTGSAGDNTDRWFIGYTPYYICAVWTGYEYPKSITGINHNPSSFVWDAIMTDIHEDILAKANSGEEPLKTFNISDNIIAATYCIDSGKLMTDACRADPRGNRAQTGWFVKGTQPTEYCDCHVMVKYDNVTKSIACDYCPEENITYVGLLQNDRLLYADLNVADAQYVYKELPYNVMPYISSDRYPFFYNMHKKGEYYGRVYYRAQFNKACTTHFDEAKWKEDVADRLNQQNPTPPTIQTPVLPSPVRSAVSDLLDKLKKR